jgi:hypothetical protein
MKPLWIGLGLIIATNAVVLAGVSYNRWGPSSAIVLTEREMRLGHTAEENSGLALRIQWVQGGDPNRPNHHGYYGPSWFDRAKLEQLGYNCHLSTDAPEAEIFYGHTVSREAYAVLEYEGPAWKALQKEREQEVARIPDRIERKERTTKDLEQAKRNLQQLRVGDSRLVLIDVGNNLHRLRETYSDVARYMIVPAMVGLVYYRAWTEKDGTFHPPYLGGIVKHLMVREINVPLEHRQYLNRLQEQDRRTGRSLEQEPRYFVSLRYGRRLEPWLQEVRPLPNQK